jgi:hypothetical protein
MSDVVSRPSVLSAVDAPKAWGWELWLTSTRAEAPARLLEPPGTLAALVASHPEVLGSWARRLFGDTLPMFSKLIHTTFPGRVHLGFRRAVARTDLLGSLEREQELLRNLFGALRTPNALAFAEYQSRYSTWATNQALAGWRRDDDEDAAAKLHDFIDPSFDLAPWLSRVRANRAALVESLNDVDLERESGNLLLTSAGVLHGIFGLSHQTHPIDRSRPCLEVLFARLAELHGSGASDDQLALAIDEAELPRLRAENEAPPKNEAWLPTRALGSSVLVEPQQTSDTTYSIADFYTPLTWSEGRASFRKGSPTEGLSRETLDRYLDHVDLGVTSLGSVRRQPELMSGASRKGAELYRLVDEPAQWPFFTAYQLELTGRFDSSPPPGVFQELVVARGRVSLGDASGPRGELSPRAPAFIPATCGRYSLEALEPSTVFIFSVPGARGSAPVIAGR